MVELKCAFHNDEAKKNDYNVLTVASAVLTKRKYRQI